MKHDIELPFPEEPRPLRRVNGERPRQPTPLTPEALELAAELAYVMHRRPVLHPAEAMQPYPGENGFAGEGAPAAWAGYEPHSPPPTMNGAHAAAAEAAEWTAPRIVQDIRRERPRQAAAWLRQAARERRRARMRQTAAWTVALVVGLSIVGAAAAAVLLRPPNQIPTLHIVIRM